LLDREKKEGSGEKKVGFEATSRERARYPGATQHPELHT
jgi:hypothetical protein